MLSERLAHRAWHGERPGGGALPTSGLAIGSYELFLFHNDQEASTGVRANASFEVVLPPTIQLQAAMYVLIATVDGPSAVRGAGDRLAICPVASVVCATPIISRDLTGTSGAERITIPNAGQLLAAGTYTRLPPRWQRRRSDERSLGWEPLIPLISTDWNPNPPPPPPPPSPHVPFCVGAWPPPSPPPELLTIQAGNQTTLQQTANGTDGSNVGAVVSIVAALVLLALFAIGACWLFRRERKDDRAESKVVLSVEVYGGPPSELIGCVFYEVEGVGRCVEAPPSSFGMLSCAPPCETSQGVPSRA